jgi:hypothetical protein
VIAVHGILISRTFVELSFYRLILELCPYARDFSNICSLDASPESVLYTVFLLCSSLADCDEFVFFLIIYEYGVPEK